MRLKLQLPNRHLLVLNAWAFRAGRQARLFIGLLPALDDRRPMDEQQAVASFLIGFRSLYAAENGLTIVPTKLYREDTRQMMVSVSLGRWEHFWIMNWEGMS